MKFLPLSFQTRHFAYLSFESAAGARHSHLTRSSVVHVSFYQSNKWRQAHFLKGKGKRTAKQTGPLPHTNERQRLLSFSKQPQQEQNQNRETSLARYRTSNQYISWIFTRSDDERVA